MGGVCQYRHLKSNAKLVISNLLLTFAPNVTFLKTIIKYTTAKNVKCADMEQFMTVGTVMCANAVLTYRIDKTTNVKNPCLKMTALYV